ncbi:autophagy-related protein 16-1-like [Photinus pyralis]|uniref:autophagy-related protein 16-1-like n=1 Tax=Photinus pyralis TaxID=7054 RepID=UPI0012677EEA|nr:autophagy-related protein 16-1-like [Photinus pyralis]
MASTEESSWRNAIFTQLQFRNRSQTEYFQDLIAAHNRLFENVDTLRNENLHLSLQNEKLRTEAVASGSSTTGSNSASEARLTERIQFLEQKLLSQQEELTELHRRKGENAQQIIDLNIKLQEKEKLLSNKEISLADSAACISSLRAEIRMYQSSIRELENLNQTIRDEHQALQLAFASLEEKLRKLQEENRQLLDRLIHYKTKDAEKMNEENDNFLNDVTRGFQLSSFRLFRKKHAKVQKELEEACKDVRAVNMDDVQEGLGPMFTSALPTKVTVKFDAHEGEVNAVKWGPDQHIVATGGADRKVQLWDISKGTFKSRGVLVGSNAAVMSVEFDCTGTLVLGASNDFASRVWSIADQRLRVLGYVKVDVVYEDFKGDLDAYIVTGNKHSLLGREWIRKLKIQLLEVGELDIVNNNVQTEISALLNKYKGILGSVDDHPLPTIDEFFAEMANGEKFTKIDLNKAYLHLEVKEEMRDILTLSTHKGLYRPTRLMFGLANAPAVWQRTIEQILQEIPEDDINVVPEVDSNRTLQSGSTTDKELSMQDSAHDKNDHIQPTMTDNANVPVFKTLYKD